MSTVSSSLTSLSYVSLFSLSSISFVPLFYHHAAQSAVLFTQTTYRVCQRVSASHAIAIIAIVALLRYFLNQLNCLLFQFP
jgi:hypothetical protein